VRDNLLYGKEHRIEDVDVVLVGDLTTLKLFAKKLTYYGFILKKYSKFGTMELEFSGANWDVALTRKEYYKFPGALPEVEFVPNLLEDSKRRDFTVNALYHDGEKVLDFHGGLEHLKEKLLVPLASFSDDPTRALRGVRYHHKLSFRYSESFCREVGSASRYIANVSPQRIINELRIASKLPAKVLLGAVKDAMRFSLLYPILKAPANLPSGAYLGRPNPYRWVILLSPFLKENLPLTKEERSILLSPEDLPPIRDIRTAHVFLHRWPDLRILNFMTWEASLREREILKHYIKLRKHLTFHLLPYNIRERDIRKILKKFGFEDIPKECMKRDVPVKERGRLKLECEAALLEMISGSNQVE